MSGERSMVVAPFEKIAIFIDGWNFAKQAMEYLRREVDFAKLLDFLSKDAFLLRAFYYIGEETEPEERSKIQPFLTWLRRNGYKVITKPIKTFINEDGEPVKKADFDVDIAIDMFDLADKVDRVILISGDGDFTKLIDRVGMKGVRTQVISYWGRGKGPTAPELIEAADEFTDLEEIIDKIARSG
ncbi:MAG TPA: NYN domain-containing protein [Candidatus Syntrophoarchaeum butanivorans]|uniref:NYN domain-containing protein n=2 Tax=Candidatus Syntropharchaeum butanivorans TaxID=1839936 RepID=A0A7C1B1K2_9EURY|nr:NYN domain-containing protein [Candidatus Syntrophoarchaeum butanivorans]HEC57334.1 NYN domain-containing protein [Candidatus Syntrophoarchaeum butanivorans]